MAKDLDKKKKKNKKPENDEKTFLISYFDDYYNSFAGTRSYSVKTKLVVSSSKKEAYIQFATAYSNKGIINIISLED